MRCIICMCEYETGEELRYLPCLHTYHRVCIDEWLTRASTCPACLEEIRPASPPFPPPLAPPTSSSAALVVPSRAEEAQIPVLNSSHTHRASMSESHQSGQYGSPPPPHSLPSSPPSQPPSSHLRQNQHCHRYSQHRQQERKPQKSIRRTISGRQLSISVPDSERFAAQSTTATRPARPSPLCVSPTQQQQLQSRSMEPAGKSIPQALPSLLLLQQFRQQHSDSHCQQPDHQSRRPDLQPEQADSTKKRSHSICSDEPVSR
ncbi:unnamed protein product, partial [Protopolystoma xenopodis]